MNLGTATWVTIKGLYTAMGMISTTYPDVYCIVDPKGVRHFVPKSGVRKATKSEIMRCQEKWK